MHAAIRQRITQSLTAPARWGRSLPDWARAVCTHSYGGRCLSAEHRIAPVDATVVTGGRLHVKTRVFGDVAAVGDVLGAGLVQGIL